eukprot:TRINITY_DN22324_c0_g1_i1.p1 TRINITY_DN22324_c0_g1~~TRINITY_DN22324_c0_g1_i1.p1  ORF type:complete len:1411 (-),score=370.16 TRINITY_DN22324_c0_g1_i1:81-4313(-)
MRARAEAALKLGAEKAAERYEDAKQRAGVLKDKAQEQAAKLRGRAKHKPVASLQQQAAENLIKLRKHSARGELQDGSAEVVVPETTGEDEDGSAEVLVPETTGKDKDAKPVLVTVEGALRQAVAAMSSYKTNKAVQEHGIATIRNIACNNKYWDEIDEMGGIDLITAAMRTHKTVAAVQEQACGALANLALKDSLREKIVQRQGMRLLQQTMKAFPDHEGVQAQTCGLLWNLVSEHPGNQGQVAELELPRLVVEAVAKYKSNDELVESALGAIANFTADNPANKEAVVQHQGPDHIVDGMKKNFESHAVQRQGCGALWGLTANSQAAQEAAIEAGALEVVNKAMSRDNSALVDVQLQENACGALRNMVAFNANHKVQAVAYGTPTHVCNSLEAHGIPGVQRQGCGTLRNLVAGDFQEECHREVLRAGGIIRLTNAVTDWKKDLSILEPACGALRCLATHAKSWGLHKARRASVQAAQKGGEEEDPNAAFEDLDIPKELMNGEMVESLCAAMTWRAESNIVQRQCLEAFRCVVSWDAGPSALKQANAVPAICEAMGRHSTDVVLQERALRVLKGLVKSGGPNRIAVVKAGGLNNIAKTMGNFSNLEVMQILGCEVLTPLAQYHAAQLQELASEDSVTAAMAAYPSQQEVQMAAAAFFSAYSQGGAQACLKGREDLLKCVASNQDNTQLLNPVLASLANITLTTGLSEGSAAMADKVCKTMVAHPLDAGIQAAGLDLLKALCASGQAGLEIAIEAECIDRVRQAMEDHRMDEGVLRAACELLRRVAGSGATYREEVISRGLFYSVRTAQVSGAASPEVCRQSLLATGTILGFLEVAGMATAERQGERRRMMIQAQQAAKARAKAAKGKGKAGGGAQPAAARGTQATIQLLETVDYDDIAKSVCVAFTAHMKNPLLLRDGCHVLHALAESSEKGRKAVHSADVVPQVCQALQTCKSNESVTFRGLRVLWSIFSHRSERRTACKNGVVECTSAAIHNFSKSIPAMSAALAVLSYVCIGELEVKQQFVEADVIPMICKAAVEHRDSKLMLDRCFHALANLVANGGPDHCAKFLEAGALEFLLEVMKTNMLAEAIQKRGLQLLWGLARGGKPSRKKVCTEANVDLALDSMGKNPKSPGVQAQACGFLWSLAAGSSKEKNLMFEKGTVLRRICMALENHRDRWYVQKNGLEVCKALSTVGGARRQQVWDSGAWERARDALSDHNERPEVLRQAIAVFCNLACHMPMFRRELFEAGAPDRILGAMEAHDRDEPLQEIACCALGNLIGFSRKRAKRLLELGGKERIIHAMTEHAANVKVKNHGTGVLKRLELVEEMVVQAVDMAEDEEERTLLDMAAENQEGDGSEDFEYSRPDDADAIESSSSDEDSMDAALQARMMELAEHTASTGKSARSIVQQSG